jgi:hypothetical protein
MSFHLFKPFLTKNPLVNVTDVPSQIVFEAILLIKVVVGSGLTSKINNPEVSLHPVDVLVPIT